MKNIIVIVSFLMLFKPVLPVLEYVVFYDYIKNELCVNRDNPDLACNGSCHLKKGMAQASDSDKEKYRFASAEISVLAFQELSIQTIPSFTLNLDQKPTFYHVNRYAFDIFNLVFRPPVW